MIHMLVVLQPTSYFLVFSYKSRLATTGLLSLIFIHLRIFLSGYTFDAVFATLGNYNEGTRDNPFQVYYSSSHYA